jgi:hypothetical protein
MCTSGKITDLSVLMALAERAGDLHALSYLCSVRPGDSMVTFHPNAAFIPKVMAVSYRSLTFELFPFFALSL